MSHIREVPEAWRNFLSLEDTPADYTGLVGQFVRINATPDGLEFTDDVVQKTGSTMTGFLTLSADPTNPLHAATKQYVDGVAQGLDWKQSVRVGTTGAITLANEQTIDSVVLVDGDRVLVKNQGGIAAHADNGIYNVVDGGAWTRAVDADENDEVTSGLACFIEEGTNQKDTAWVLVTDDPITVGSTAQEYAKFSSPGDYTAGTGLTESPARTFNADFEDTDGNINPIGAQDAGTSDKVARADHVHAHGDQGGGSEHALVIALGAAGFMSGADKDKLDGVSPGAEVNQFAWSYVDVNSAESLQSADAKTDTLYFVEANVVDISGDGDDTITFGLTAGSNGQVVKTVAGTPTWAAVAFLELSDTPAAYTGAGAGIVAVNSGASGLEFIGTAAAQGEILYFNGTNWVALGVGTNGYVLTTGGAAANPAWTSVATTFLGLTDTPVNYTGAAGKLVAVNSTPDGLEFVDLTGVPSSGTTGYTLYWNGSAWVESGIIFNDHANAEVGVNTQAPNSTLEVDGSFAANLATYLVTTDLGSGSNGDARTIIVNNAAAATITLPPASGLNGREYNIKKISATGGGRNVTIDGSGGEFIDGVLTKVLNKQYEALTVICDGSNWFIV